MDTYRTAVTFHAMIWLGFVFIGCLQVCSSVVCSLKTTWNFIYSSFQGDICAAVHIGVLLPLCAYHSMLFFYAGSISHLSLQFCTVTHNGFHCCSH